jgi:hypothetical protein
MHHLPYLSDGNGAQTSEIAAKSLCRQKITISYSCALSSMYIISQCYRFKSAVHVLAFRNLGISEKGKQLTPEQNI